MQIEFDDARKSRRPGARRRHRIRGAGAESPASAAAARSASRSGASGASAERLMTESNELIEIAVVDPQNQILADSDPDRVGVVSPPYHEFDELVNGTSWIQKLKLLGGREEHLLPDGKGAGAGRRRDRWFTVRVVVYPLADRAPLHLAHAQAQRRNRHAVVRRFGGADFCHIGARIPPARAIGPHARPGGQRRIRARKATPPTRRPTTNCR